MIPMVIYLLKSHPGTESRTGDGAPVHHGDDHLAYPVYPLTGRIRLAYDWLPVRPSTLLDGGCAWGYGTRFFAMKACRTFGIDSNEDYIEVARDRYPDIVFRACRLENTPFETGFFECVVLNDVIEHVPDEKVVLDEVHRILKPGGILIITAPHRGLFSFMDTDNHRFYLRVFLPELAERISRGRKPLFPAEPPFPENRKHRHYSVAELVRVIGSSRFAGGCD